LFALVELGAKMPDLVLSNAEMCLFDQLLNGSLARAETTDLLDFFRRRISTAMFARVTAFSRAGRAIHEYRPSGQGWTMINLGIGRALLLRTLSEATWQTQVIAWARRAGWHGVRILRSDRNTRGVQPEDAWGWPDLLLVHPRRGVLALELKAERGRLTPAQRRWLELLGAAGIPAQVRRLLGVQECLPLEARA
jgi:hypothetical protein